MQGDSKNQRWLQSSLSQLSGFCSKPWSLKTFSELGWKNVMLSNPQSPLFQRRLQEFCSNKSIQAESKTGNTHGHLCKWLTFSRARNNWKKQKFKWKILGNNYVLGTALLPIICCLCRGVIPLLKPIQLYFSTFSWFETFQWYICIYI